MLGLDGASFDVIQPLVEQGRLPNLGAWMKQGSAAELRSTVPPVSFPAWSSFLTGLGPGRHGLFDFTQKLPGRYRLRFTNASDRSGTSLGMAASRAKRRVLILGVPGTYPPEPVSGLLVSGFDSPVSAGTRERSASDPSLYAAIAARVGPWMEASLDESARAPDFHERAVGALLTRIERKTAFALDALERLRRSEAGGPELMTVVFSESDTVSHHYWRDHDPRSPRHDPGASACRRGAVAAVYEKLDAACGEIRAAFGEDAPCLVMSDHGSGGASQRLVHLNARLAECGLLRRRHARGTPGLDALGRGARDLALRALPPTLAQWAFRRARGTAARVESAARFGGIDWTGSAAFSEEANTQPGIWINLKGREAQGCVAADDYENLRDEVIDALLDWKLPSGDPVVARARRREEVYTGPFVSRSPDVVIELGLDEGYGLSVVPTPWRGSSAPSLRTLLPRDFAGGRGRGMNGTHRPEGILISSGDAAPVFREDLTPRIEDLAPTVLSLLGVSLKEWEDGMALEAGRIDYTPEEQEQVSNRLRSLGYLE